MKERILLSFFAQTDPYTTLDTTQTGSYAEGMFALMLGLAIALVAIIGLWKVNTKAGQPGWASIVPIYNIYIMLKIAGRPTWWMLSILLMFIPIIGTVISLALSIVIGIDIAKRFGKSTLFGALLNGLLGIGYLIIGFGSAQYNKPETMQPAVTPPAAPPSTS